MTPTEKLSKHPFGFWSLALYGMTHTGKSTQAAMVASYVFRKSGLKTLWYLFDEGETPADVDTGIEAGYIKIVDMRGVPHPYLSMKKIAAGYVPEFNGKFDGEKMVAGGKFVPGKFDDIGLLVVDSGSSICEKLFKGLSELGAAGINIGGEGNANFTDGDDEWGKRKVGSPNISHYNTTQVEFYGLVGRLKQLCARHGMMMLMTFGEDRGNAETTKVTFIGPMTKGSAQTPLVPGWFKFTFRLVSLPSGQNAEPKRVLWTERHKDGGVEALANRRFPILTEEEQKVYLPMYAPADVVKALTTYQEIVKIRGGGQQ